jgi:hypothetical protein
LVCIWRKLSSLTEVPQRKFRLHGEIIAREYAFPNQREPSMHRAVPAFIQMRWRRLVPVSSPVQGQRGLCWVK